MRTEMANPISRINKNINFLVVPALFLAMWIAGIALNTIGYVDIGETFSMIGRPLFLLSGIPIGAWYFVKFTRPVEDG